MLAFVQQHHGSVEIPFHVDWVIDGALTVRASAVTDFGERFPDVRGPRWWGRRSSPHR